MGKKNKSLLSVQNKYRGLFSILNSHKVSLGKSNTNETIFKSALKEVLLEARSVLDVTAYSSFLEWVKIHNKRNSIFFKGGDEYDELSGVVEYSVVGIDKELYWLKERLLSVAEEINYFLDAKSDIEKDVCGGEEGCALEKLDVLTKKCGHSMWSVALKIALEQSVNGLESQKEYVSDVRGRFRQGLLSFYAYYVSVRNEPQTILDRFSSDVAVRLENHEKYSDDVKKYLKYKLIQDDPVSIEDAAAILRIEQSSSVIDVYETFINVCQSAVKAVDGWGSGISEIVVSCLGSMNGINDYRIKKMRVLLGDMAVAHEMEFSNASIATKIFESNFSGAYRTYLKKSANINRDPWELIYVGFSKGGARVGNRKGGVPNFTKMISGLAKGEGDKRELDITIKYFANFSALPFGVAIKDWFSLVKRKDFSDGWPYWHVGLNSAYFRIEDLSSSRGMSERELKMLFGIDGEYAKFWLLVLGVVNCDHESIDREEVIAKSLFFLRNNDPARASSALKSIDCFDEVGFGNVILLLLRMNAYAYISSKKSVVEIITDMAVNEFYEMFLPADLPNRDYVWGDYKLVDNNIISSIALSLLMRSEDKSIYGSMMRFCVRGAQRKYGVTRPSELAPELGISNEVLIYYWSKVCALNVIDMCGAVSSTRGVLEERREVLNKLFDLDPHNKDAYQIEFMDIGNRLALDEGQRIVDSTRIHVDEDALVRNACRNFGQEFARYRDLVNLGEVARQNFDDVLAEISSTKMTSELSSQQYDEADAILASVLARMADDFLHSSKYGFDFYLSQRIRHQSFIGLIRSPIEDRMLITVKDSEKGEYKDNNHWVSRLKRSEVDPCLKVNELLKEFSEKVDQCLIYAKENKFHICSDYKPEGLVRLSLWKGMVDVIRSITYEDEDAVEFFSTFPHILWAAAEPSLHDVRKYISDTMKHEFAAIFDELRSGLKNAGLKEKDYMEMDLEIGSCSFEVQAALDDAAGWFAKSSIEYQKKKFTVRQIFDIASDSAKRINKKFFDNLDVDYDFNGCEGVPFKATTMVFVNDIIMVAFDNIKRHSNLDDPRVSVNVDYREEKSVIVVRVESDVRIKGVQRAFDSINRIREKIEKKDFSKARREGGSGLIKLASLTNQSSKSWIDFDLVQGRQDYFFVEVALAVSIEGD